jgi:hypothetical protein
MAKNPVRFRVIVGNVGQVYEGSSLGDAREQFRGYRDMSRDGLGGIAGEEVTLIESADGYDDAIEEFIPSHYDD